MDVSRGEDIETDEPDKDCEDEAPSWCVYVLRCNDGSFYTGVTSNLKKRLLTHQEGKGSRYVRSHRPFVVAKILRCKDEHEARSLEYRLKRMSRSEKVAFWGWT